MLSRFELLLTPSARKQLSTLTNAYDLPAAAVVRLALAKMATAHQRKTKRRAAPAMPVPASAPPAAAPSAQTMSLAELQARRDQLAQQRTVEASREYDEVHQRIMVLEMRGAPR